MSTFFAAGTGIATVLMCIVLLSIWGDIYKDYPRKRDGSNKIVVETMEIMIT